MFEHINGSKHSLRVSSFEHKLALPDYRNIEQIKSVPELNSMEKEVHRRMEENEKLFHSTKLNDRIPKIPEHFQNLLWNIERQRSYLKRKANLRGDEDTVPCLKKNCNS